MEGLQFNKALDALWDLVRAGNKYIDTQQPWALNKAGDTERLATVMRHVLEVCFFAGVLLRGVMPHKSVELLTKLGRSEEAAQHWLTGALAAKEANLDALPAGLDVLVGDPLFPRHREMPEKIAELLAAAVPVEAPKKPKKKKKAKGGPAEVIEFEDFEKISLKAGTVLSAEPHPDADKLLVVKVDIGEERPRTIVAGIKSRFSADELVGRKVVVVANLAPRKMRGVMSEGMLREDYWLAMASTAASQLSLVVSVSASFSTVIFSMASSIAAKSGFSER